MVEEYLNLLEDLLDFFLNKCYSILIGKPHKSLSFYFKETKDETFSNGAENHVVGVIFFGLIVLITIFVMSPEGRKFFSK